MVELVRDQAPPRPVSELPPGPQQVEAAASRPVPRELEKVRITEAQDQVEPLLIPERTPQPESAVQATPAPATTAPLSRPAPPAASASSASSDWRGRLLAHLESNKRYPAAALARRQPGRRPCALRYGSAGPRPDRADRSQLGRAGSGPCSAGYADPCSTPAKTSGRGRGRTDRTGRAGRVLRREKRMRPFVSGPGAQRGQYPVAVLRLSPSRRSGGRRVGPCFRCDRRSGRIACPVRSTSGRSRGDAGWCPAANRRSRSIPADRFFLFGDFDHARGPPPLRQL